MVCCPRERKKRCVTLYKQRYRSTVYVSYKSIVVQGNYTTKFMYHKQLLTTQALTWTSFVRSSNGAFNAKSTLLKIHDNETKGHLISFCGVFSHNALISWFIFNALKAYVLCEINKKSCRAKSIKWNALINFCFVQQKNVPSYLIQIQTVYQRKVGFKSVFIIYLIRIERYASWKDSWLRAVMNEKKTILQKLIDVKRITICVCMFSITARQNWFFFRLLRRE